MKVYVDELPKSCKKCPYFIEGGFLCRMNDCKMLDMVGENSVWNGRDKDCPLQSLSDHDKQVRKEVCEEIRDKLGMFPIRCIEHTAFSVKYDRLDEILDQIGETK